ncbi:MAG: ABC transporter ATP-binding protein [Deltaproteobacteria bacterium]|nr:ABC transporter ATP-binding protein [Deltaproteobacteria bacterium]MBZ0219319.1 ABC transporter ATP-binding protein [Deltaproteobacteria bacterium]
MAGIMESALVSIRGINKSYTRGSRVIPVLRDINLDIEKAGFMALMGPSGSGKSTLLNLIAGIDRPDSGTIEIGGIETTYLTEAELASWRSDHVGFIFQFYNLMPVLTAIENVELPLLLKDMPRKERRERAGTLLGLVGLSERLDHYPGELSGGEQQRVAISRAMVTDPTILVADEPTGDLDMESAEEVLHLMERLNKEFGKTIILVTHDPRAAGKARTVRRLEKGYLNAGTP